MKVHTLLLAIVLVCPLHAQRGRVEKSRIEVDPAERAERRRIYDFLITGEWRQTRESGWEWRARSEGTTGEWRVGPGGKAAVFRYEINNRPFPKEFFDKTERVLTMLRPIVLTPADSILAENQEQISLDPKKRPDSKSQALIALAPPETETNKLMLLTCVHTPNEEIITIYQPVSVSGVTANVYRILNGASSAVTTTALPKLLNPIAGGRGRLFVVGDRATTINVEALAEQYGFETVNRSFWNTTSIIEANKSLNALQGHKIVPQTTLVVEGTFPEIQSSATFPSEWRSFGRQLRAVEKSSYVVLRKKSEVLERLTKGDDDVIFFVAHANRFEIELDGTTLTVKDLLAQVHQRGTGRQRVAVVVGCSERRTDMAEKGRATFAEGLTALGYFDAVYTWEDEMTLRDARSLISKLLTGRALPLAAFRTGKMKINAELLKRTFGGLNGSPRALIPHEVPGYAPKLVVNPRR